MIGAMTGLWGHWANLGYGVCDQTVGNVLQRHGLSPAPERKRTTSWPAFIRTHLALLAGTEFFTAEVLHITRADNLLRAIFYPPSEPPGVHAGITVYADERP